jgi:hypothetical protein
MKKAWRNGDRDRQERGHKKAERLLAVIEESERRINLACGNTSPVDHSLDGADPDAAPIGAFSAPRDSAKKANPER